MLFYVEFHHSYCIVDFKMDQQRLAQLAKEVNEDESTKDSKIQELKHILKNHRLLANHRSGENFKQFQYSTYHKFISNNY